MDFRYYGIEETRSASDSVSAARYRACDICWVLIIISIPWCDVWHPSVSNPYFIYLLVLVYV